MTLTAQNNISIGFKILILSEVMASISLINDAISYALGSLMDYYLLIILFNCVYVA